MVCSFILIVERPFLFSVFYLKYSYNKECLLRRILCVLVAALGLILLSSNSIASLSAKELSIECIFKRKVSFENRNIPSDRPLIFKMKNDSDKKGVRLYDVQLKGLAGQVKWASNGDFSLDFEDKMYNSEGHLKSVLDPKRFPPVELKYETKTKKGQKINYSIQCI